MREPSNRQQSPIDVRVPPCGVSVLESHHSDTFHMEMGSWPFDKICWVPMGQGELVLPDSRVSITSNDFVLLPRACSHQFVDDPANPLTLVIACVDYSGKTMSESLNRLLSNTFSSTRIGTPLRALNDRINTTIGDAFRKMLREQAQRLPGYEVALHAELSVILIHLTRDCSDCPTPTRDSEQAIIDALLYLDEYFYKPIKLDELAESYDISVRRFSDLFKQRTGKTFVDYVNSKRIESAKIRLRATGNISYAALESGFNDLGYFYRVFKKYTGQTPGDYLRSSEEQES